MIQFSISPLNEDSVTTCILYKIHIAILSVGSYVFTLERTLHQFLKTTSYNPYTPTKLSATCQLAIPVSVRSYYLEAEEHREGSHLPGVDLISKALCSSFCLCCLLFGKFQNVTTQTPKRNKSFFVAGFTLLIPFHTYHLIIGM